VESIPSADHSQLLSKLSLVHPELPPLSALLRSCFERTEASQAAYRQAMTGIGESARAVLEPPIGELARQLATGPVQAVLPQLDVLFADIQPGTPVGDLLILADQSEAEDARQEAARRLLLRSRLLP